VDLGIRGKVALVTGASSGIGEAVALALAREGVRLAVAARRQERLEDVAARALRAGAPQARAFTADQTSAASLEKLVAAVEAELGAVEILIANGGGPKPGTFTQMTPAEWDAGYVLTLQGALHLVRLALPGMRARRWGRIVNLGSRAALGKEGRTGYATTKAGILGRWAAARAKFVRSATAIKAFNSANCVRFIMSAIMWLTHIIYSHCPVF